jgi:hypothetical protein
MAINIKYNLGNHGWANVKLAKGLKNVTMTVSYLHDTLADFICAVNLLLKGAPEAKVLLMDEPGEHLIYLQSVDGVNLTIEVRWFKDWASWDLITEKEYEVVFRAEDTVLNFATQVFTSAEHLLRQYGADRYKERWMEHDFPMNEYKRLKLLLKK